MIFIVPKTLKRVAELCQKYNVIMISDEIHSDFVYKSYRHIPIASVSEWIFKNSVTLISPTKTFNLAGLAESIAIIPNEELSLKFKKTLIKTGAGMLNIFGLEAAEAAYTYGEEWLDELIEYLNANLEMLINYLRENIPQIKVIRPEATYLAWIDCSELQMDEGGLKDFFVYKAGVGLNDGIVFGEEGYGFQRLNFACPRSLLLEGLHKMKNALEQQKSTKHMG